MFIFMAFDIDFNLIQEKKRFKLDVLVLFTDIFQNNRTIFAL